MWKAATEMHGHRHDCSPREAERRDARREPEFRELDKARDPDLRASDHDRNEAVRALSEHTAAGRLTLDEFEQRVGAVFTAQRVGELEPLLADLPATRRPSVRDGDRSRAGWARADWGLWRAWLLAGAICIAIWAMASIGSARLLYFWPIWVIGPWGVSMIFRGMGTCTRAGRPTG